MNLFLEVSLKPSRVASFLSKVKSPLVKINYDTGNSAYWDYDTDKEFLLYGNRIGNVHIKDCTPEKYSVPLGKGSVNFDNTFQWPKKIQYSGNFVLQTARGNEDIKVAIDYREFTELYIRKYLL